MSETSSTASLPLTVPTVGGGTTAALLSGTLLRVTAFWWAATGLIIASQRDETTRTAAFAAASALGLLGAWFIHRSRGEATASGARHGLAGAALLWTWVAIALYGGFVVGPGGRPVAADASRLTLALEAVRSIAFHEAAALTVVALAVALTWRSPNRFAVRTLTAFWATNQLAKLNVFAGVANPGERFLPDWLRFLEVYFGPAQNTVLLPLSVLVLAAAGTWLLARAVRGRDPYAREGDGMIGWLVLLAALEHALLGISWNAPLWDVFLTLRG